MPLQGRQGADRIFGSGLGKRLINDIGEGGEEIGEIEELIVACCGRDLSGPAGDEGDAVAAFVGVAFSVFPRAIGDVAKLFSISFGCFELGADITGIVGEVEVDVVGAFEVFGSGPVVASEDEEGIIRTLSQDI